MPFGSGTLNTGWGSAMAAVSAADRAGPAARVGAAMVWAERAGHRHGTGTGERQVAVSSGAGSGSGGLSGSRSVASSWPISARCAPVTRARPKRNPNLKGGMTVNWQIAPEGNVSAGEPGQFFARQPAGRGVRRTTGEGLEVSLERGTFQCELAFQVWLSGGASPWHGARSTTRCCLQVLDLA